MGPNAAHVTVLAGVDPDGKIALVHGWGNRYQYIGLPQVQQAVL